MNSQSHQLEKVQISVPWYKEAFGRDIRFPAHTPRQSEPFGTIKSKVIQVKYPSNKTRPWLYIAQYQPVSFSFPFGVIRTIPEGQKNWSALVSCFQMLCPSWLLAAAVLCFHCPYVDAGRCLGLIDCMGLKYNGQKLVRFILRHW